MVAEDKSDGEPLCCLATWASDLTDILRQFDSEYNSAPQVREIELRSLPSPASEDLQAGEDRSQGRA